MIELNFPFVLASGSPRRRELLENAGLSFEILEVPPEEEDGVDAALSPSEGAGRRAQAKAEWAARRRPEAVVLGADTIVVLEDEVLGKPVDAEDARRMLARLSGRTHRVITGFTLILGGECRTRSVKTEIAFRTLDAESIGRYVENGEPMDKAGAYAIQGAGGGFIDKVIGSYTNVVGLPLPEVLAALAGFGAIKKEISG